MRWRLGVLVWLGAVTAARAATWTCGAQVEELAQKTYTVASRCTAAGAYTSGGDVVGDGSDASRNKQLCGSPQRIPKGVILSNTANETGAETFVATWNLTTQRIQLATQGTTTAAAAAPRIVPPGAPLVEALAGTPLDGFTIRILAFCQ